MSTINAIGVGLSGASGTGNFAGTTSPTFVTPTLGVASATSINFGGSSLANYVASTSWTPTFSFATAGDLSVSYSTQLGVYTRIGDIVFLKLNLVCTPTFTTASGVAEITGLPITSASDSVAQQGQLFAAISTFSTSYTYIGLSINPGANLLTISKGGSGVNNASITTANFISGNAIQFVGTIFYFV